VSGQRRERRSAQRDRRLASPLLRLPFGRLRNPFPPLERLNPQQVEQLHRASIHILENIGLDFLDEEALRIWEKAGARVDRTRQHVWLDGGLVLEAVSKAPGVFTWHARNPARDVIIGGDAITFAPHSGMVYVSDLDRGRRRATFSDFERFLKLAQMSNVLHFAGSELVAASDVPPTFRHLRRMLAAFTLTDKAVRDVAHGRIIPADNLKMARIVFGDDLAQKPVIGGVINVNSPLRYDTRMLGGMMTYARAGQINIITPFILAGAMSPITLPSAIAQQNAEALAGIALTQLVNPGAPVIYGGFTTNTDMKSGSPAFGTPEGALALLIGAQLARRYGLPYRGSGSLNTSKVPDAQAAYEAMWTLWPAVLAHANFIHHSVGWLESGLTASFEKFIIDAENLAMFHHFLQEISIDEDTLALDMIAEVGPGGHHFGTPHTQTRYESEFYQPFLSDRLNYESWRVAGALDAAQRANLVWKMLLDEYQTPELDQSTLEGLLAYVGRRERELEGKNLYDE
jgi:trimethylamine---corrinoid protein Co-methyltransferase